MDLQLRDKVFLVTAASAGLGLATARVLVEEGARVVLVARGADALEAAAAALGGPERARTLTGDLGAAHEADAHETDAHDDLPTRACRTALEAWGRLDGALISVGGPPRGSVLGPDDATWRAAFDSVFLAALRTLRAVVAASTADDLALALVLSTSVEAPLPTMALSNGLRPGLGMLVRQLAAEIGPQGARVVGLLPGSIETGRIEELLAAAEDPAAARAAAEAQVPLRRHGRPEEFGRVAVFVLSPAASYLTGSMIAVDGGALGAP